jgi:hypothetical protein
MAALFFVIAALVSVDAPDGCLDAAVIETAWRALSPTLASDEGRHAKIDAPTPDSVHIELRDSHDALIAERVIARKADCDDMLRTIAVTLASWESAVRAPDALPLALPSPPPQASPPPTMVLPIARAKPRSRLAWEVEAAALGSVAGGAFAPGGSAEIYLGKIGFPLGARIGIAGVDGHRLTLAPGHIEWGRLAATASPSVQVLHKVIRLEVHADLLLGAAFLSGSGFYVNYASHAFDGALGGGLRASVERWPVTPWIDVSVLGWITKQNANAVVDGEQVSSTLPRFDVWLRLGIAYGRRR